jgi:hypothetical protein
MANFQVIFRIQSVPLPGGGVGDRPVPDPPLPPLPPLPPIPVMMVGDTVSYTTPDGTLKLTFTRTGPLPLPVPPADSPFTSGETVVPDSNPRTLANAGLYHCACEITKPDGTVVKWKPEDKKSGGGDHDVRPPGAPA